MCWYASKYVGLPRGVDYEIYVLGVGFGCYKLYQSQTQGDVQRYASKDVGPQGKWIVRSHVVWRKEQNIPCGMCQRGRWAPREWAWIITNDIRGRHRVMCNDMPARMLGPSRGVDCEIYLLVMSFAYYKWYYSETQGDAQWYSSEDAGESFWLWFVLFIKTKEKKLSLVGDKSVQKIWRFEIFLWTGSGRV